MSHTQKNQPPDILAEAVAFLDAGLTKWIQEQGIELDKAATCTERRVIDSLRIGIRPDRSPMPS